MAGKNEWEAADNFVGYLHETLSCVTTAKLAFFQQSKNFTRCGLILPQNSQRDREPNCFFPLLKFWDLAPTQSSPESSKFRPVNTAID